MTPFPYTEPREAATASFSVRAGRTKGKSQVVGELQERRLRFPGKISLGEWNNCRAGGPRFQHMGGRGK
jgi:hypothetical protein